MEGNMYTGFASVYDIFMDSIPYDDWAEYLCKILKEHGIDHGTLAELGCGTGNISIRMADAGFQVIGIDLSEEMLELAFDKKEDRNILYVNQDMRDFELNGKVDVIYSLCDSMNYLLEYEDLVETFFRVSAFLEEGGIFVFDAKTWSFYEQIGDSVIAENREIGSFIWENDFCDEDGINEYDLTIYAQNEEGTYERFEEIHKQRAYPIAVWKEAMEEAGLKCLHVYRAFTDEEASEEDDRIYFVATRA